MERISWSEVADEMNEIINSNINTSLRVDSIINHIEKNLHKLNTKNKKRFSASAKSMMKQVFGNKF